jgi:hypothetical protein
LPQPRTEEKKADEEEEDAGKIDMRTRVKIQELKEHGVELYKKQKFEEAIKCARPSLACTRPAHPSARAQVLLSGAGGVPC